MYYTGLLSQNLPVLYLLMKIMILFVDVEDLQFALKYVISLFSNLFSFLDCTAVYDRSLLQVERTLLGKHNFRGGPLSLVLLVCWTKDNIYEGTTLITAKVINV